MDTHCHLDDERYAADRNDVLRRAQEAGVAYMLSIGCDLATSQGALGVAHGQAQVFATVGVHPHEAAKASAEDLQHIEVLAQDPKCIGIGECGLDYYYEHSPRDVQERILRAQIQMALRLRKALVLHVRDAYEECLRILQEEKAFGVPVVVHCFTADARIAKMLVDAGSYLSIAGVVTFKKSTALQEAVKAIPLDRLLIETDAPYLTPEPHRGKRNEPAMLVLVAQKLAELKGVDRAVIAQHTTQNAFKVFQLKE